MEASSSKTYPFLVWMKGEVSYFGPKSAMDADRIALEILRAFPYLPLTFTGQAFILHKLVQEVTSSSCVLSAGAGHVRYSFAPNWRGMCIVPGLLSKGTVSVKASRNNEMCPGSNTNSVLLINIKVALSDFDAAKWSGASSDGFAFLDTPPASYAQVCEGLAIPSKPPSPGGDSLTPKKDKKKGKIDYNMFKLPSADPSLPSSSK
uniref:Matrix protein n=1 Tax=North Fork virus TaxID=3139876 RepID=A0AAN0LQT2_9VIRU